MARNSLITAAILFLILAVYAKTIGHPFNARDDGKLIYQNPRMTHGPIGHIPFYWQNPHHGLYIPVTMSSWLVMARAAGTSLNYEIASQPTISPALFHFSNVALHMASTLVVLLLLYLLLERKSFTAAALGAAVFAMHPLQVEPVAWVSGMKDTLSTLGALSSLLVYFIGTRFGGKERPLFAWTCYLLALVLFAAALLAKPAPLAFVPVTLFLIDLLLLKISWPKSLLRIAPFLAASIAIAIVTYRSQLTPHTLTEFVPPSVIARPLIAADALGFYLTKLAFPLSLGLDYGRTPDRVLAHSIFSPFWIVALAIAATAAWFIFRKRNYLLALGAGAAIAGILPVLGLVPFTYQQQSTVADRYMYLPMFGIVFCLAAFLTGARRPWKIAAVMAVAGFTVLSGLQAGRWKTSESIFTHSLKVNPSSAPMAYNLGGVSMNQKRYDDAIAFYQKAAQIQPEFPLSYDSIGYVYLQKKEFAKAAPYFQRALDLNPRMARTYTHLAICTHELGDTERSVTLFLRALDIQPGAPDAALGLAVANAKLGHFEDAETYFKKAIDLSPGWPQPIVTAGAFYMNRGRYADAIATFEKLVQLQRGDPSARALLAEAYARDDRIDDAIREVRTALQLAERAPSFPAQRRQALEEVLRKYEAYQK